MLLFHGRKNFREMLWTFRYWMYIMGSSLKEMMIPMLKKLTALSLSLDPYSRGDAHCYTQQTLALTT